MSIGSSMLFGFKSAIKWLLGYNVDSVVIQDVVFKLPQIGLLWS